MRHIPHKDSAKMLIQLRHDVARAVLQVLHGYIAKWKDGSNVERTITCIAILNACIATRVGCLVQK